jgi:MoxR-like ATPase
MMSQTYFINKSVTPHLSDEVKPTWRPEQLNKATGYLPDAHLVDAMNVSLLLGQPLLLTGEPGTGKTQFAYYVSWMLGLHPPLVFDTKSTSTARELFYSYDALGRFRDAQSKRGGSMFSDQLEYITWSALGEAILRAAEGDDFKLLSPSSPHSHERKSVVLIDEVDKAPRDFPNDILNEVESLYFRIPELRDPKSNAAFTVEAKAGLRPIIILTSNSEKNLPDPFLRRCVYYNILPPKKPELLKIVDTRIGRELGGAEAWLEDALDFFFILRDQNNGIQKKPATAELLGWLRTLYRMRESHADGGRPLRHQKEMIVPTLTVLLKNSTDQETGREILKKWQAG